jgi:hypothetical protein
MNKLTAVGIGAGAILLYSLFTKQKALESLVFYPHSLKDIRFDGVTPVMTLGLAVQNTSNKKFTLNSIAGILYANNYIIGNISGFIPQVIPANSQTIIFIKARLSLIGIVSDVIRAIKNKTFSETLELESKANIDNLQVPVNLKYKFSK